uniref:Uncharacterized protein n=1 Tax=Ciona intestinalis TaxID=7719 RepID=H2XRZ0_CIOIN
MWLVWSMHLTSQTTCLVLVSGPMMEMHTSFYMSGQRISHQIKQMYMRRYISTCARIYTKEEIS